MIKRVVALIAAIVGVFLASLAPAVAIPDTPAATTPTFDFVHHSTPTASAVTERGPPGAHELTAVYDYDAGDRWSRGALVPSERAASSVAYTYDDNARLAHVARGIPTAERRVQATRAISGAFSRGGVAANTGAHALPAFPKALAGGPANTHVYLGITNGKPAYAGITTNIGNRSTQHGSRFDQLQQLTTTPLSRGQARSVEEALILRNAGTFSNLRHEIGIKHSYYGDAVQWGEAWLVRNGL